MHLKQGRRNNWRSLGIQGDARPDSSSERSQGGGAEACTQVRSRVEKQVNYGKICIFRSVVHAVEICVAMCMYVDWCGQHN